MAQLILPPHHWQSVDCTILIPVPAPRSPSPLPDVGAQDICSAPRLTFRLHREYLASKSLFFRRLFSGASPTDLIQSICASHRSPPSVPLRVPRSRLPRLLPSPPSHPIVFLPVPDPSSIQPLLHWMYFGNTDHIQNALDRGDIQWEGLARNVEYLALSTDIKVFLGRWYRCWYLPACCSPDTSPCLADEGDESDLESDSDSDVCYLPSDDDGDDEEMESDGECDRGRTRDIKPLVRMCGQLRLCTA